jgi:uncharacterized membrane protein YphA (DoxX/SURF4 family)
MDVTYQVLRALSMVLFFYYGVSVLVSEAMVEEFEKFGLIRFRRVTGVLEVLGAVGLMLGYFIPPLVIAASGGLTLLMILGVAVRYRAGSTLLQALPALVMALINVYIFVYAIGLIGTTPGS